MLKVLLIAPTIDQGDIGEAWVAYQWAHHLSERHNVTVLTYRKRGKPAIGPQLPQARVIEWLEPRLLGRAERLNSLLKPGYFPFAWRARRWIRRALADGERFDVAHQPLPVAMRYPSPLAGLSVPYLIGPVGGGLEAPTAFDQQDTAPWFVQLRRLDRYRLRYDPALRRTYARAACVLGIAPYVGDLLREVPLRQLRFLSETGLTALPEPIVREPSPGPVRLLFVGRVIRTKGVRDLVTAVAQVDGVEVAVDIVGDGYDRPSCEALAEKLGVTDRVVFHGQKPRTEVDDFYRSADIFVFPSYREPGGNAPFEAMSFGLPLIVADSGGPAAAVDASCAIRVPASTPAQFARDLAQAITELAADPERRRRLGTAARERVAQVGLWSSKVVAVEGLYAEIIEASASNGAVLHRG